MFTRAIPSSSQQLPVIGLGTWKTFDVSHADKNPELLNVLNEMKNGGGKLIDSSPMYGRSEEVIGQLSQSTNDADHFFYATKVWTTGRDQGIQQMKSSLKKLRREHIDLMQIHNLVDWKTHLKTLREWKEQGLVKYIGFTHYTDSMHGELEELMRKEKPDFVQFNYSIFARNAEKRLLPAAGELGIATLINRPFGEGAWFSKVKNKNLPSFARELGIYSWSQFFLKFIIAHPSVTCVIPATSSPEHMVDNLKAAAGPLPDKEQLEKMAEFVLSL